MKKVEIILFGTPALLGFILYTVAGFPLHFFTHFFPAISAGLVVLLILTQVGIEIGKYEVKIPFLFWIYAVIPELIVVDQQHPRWTNIFLLHEWLDDLLALSTMTIVANGFITLFLLALYSKLRKS